MPRITRAGGVTDVRRPPPSDVGPSVDEMLRARPRDVEADEPGDEAAPVAGSAEDDAGTGTEDPGAGASTDDDDRQPGEETDEPDPPPSEPSTADVREWARANGHDVADAGPIPNAVREAFDAAHAGVPDEG